MSIAFVLVVVCQAARLVERHFGYFAGMSVGRGGVTMWSVVSTAAVVLVTVVIFAVALALIWWLWSVFGDPLAYSQPDAIAAAKRLGWAVLPA